MKNKKKETKLKELKDYTLISLLKDGKNRGLTPYDLGVIIASAVRGEPCRNINYHKLAFDLRDKIYSVLNEIEKKGKEAVMWKKEKEFKKEFKVPPSSPNLWYAIYDYFFKKEIKAIKGSFREEDFDPKSHKDFFENLYKSLVSIEVRGLNEILVEEYKSFVGKLLNMRAEVDEVGNERTKKQDKF
ncbi:MAG: hypothetical protein QXQ82_00775 [Candidatus Pacearchaeota archaeon]